MYALLFADEKDEAALLATIIRQIGLVVKAVQPDSGITPETGDQPILLMVLAVAGVVDDALIQSVRARYNIPLVVVSDALPEREQCRLLETGVDMVVMRPFSSRLLMAQLRALLRRPNAPAVMNLPSLKVAGLVLDPATRVVKIGNRPAHRLTHLEFRLFYTLMIYRGQVVPTEKIVEAVWGYGGQGDRELVRGLVSRVRGKVEKNPQKPAFIITVPGIGYVFDPQDDNL